MNLNRLNPSFRILYVDFNACAVGNRTLAEVAQHIGM